MSILKNKRLFITMIFIVLAVFNIIAFLLPLEREGMFWTGYGFSMVAFLLTSMVGFYALGREGLKSKVYRCPLIFLVWSYLLVQLVIGILEMIFVFVPYQYGIVLNSILLCVCLIGVLASEISNEEVERIDKKIKEKVLYIKTLQTDIEDMTGRVADEAAKKMLSDLSEAIRYSDPMSSQQLATIENKIKTKVTDLSDAVVAANVSIIKIICEEIQQLIAERNRKCKAIK